MDNDKFIEASENIKDLNQPGQFVSSSTQVGNMGSTGCSTGPHLHLEVSNCFWERGGCNYDQYLNNIINPSSLFSIPSSWNNR